MDNVKCEAGTHLPLNPPPEGDKKENLALPSARGDNDGRKEGLDCRIKSDNDGRKEVLDCRIKSDNDGRRESSIFNPLKFSREAPII